MRRPETVNAYSSEVEDRPAATALAGNAELQPKRDTVVRSARAHESLPVARLAENLRGAAAIRRTRDGRDVREAAV
jgi:hypothetical protein